ncbi:MAG: TetR/AcrR family transcriptional regulator [Ilumatobacteraceae bacterium]
MAISTIYSHSELEARSRIIEAAREEVLNRGILGLRVANIARIAGCSITSMYRYFGSRDGVLAEVLLQLYEESFAEIYALVLERLGGTGPVVVDDIVACIPMPHSETSQKQHEIRSQVLAVAGTNPILRTKLSASMRARRAMLSKVLDELEHRLPAEVKLDRDIFTVLIFNVNFQYNDLMGDDAVTNEQYAALLRRLIIRE